MNFNIKLNPKKINVPFLHISCTPQVKDSQNDQNDCGIKKEIMQMKHDNPTL